MAQSTTVTNRDPFPSLRTRLNQQEGLPFLDLLSPETVAQACHQNHHRLARSHLHPLDHPRHLPLPNPLR